MNRFRKISAALLAFLFSLLFSVPAAAADTKGLDIVVVLDASGSMKTNDAISENYDIGKRFLVPGVETLITALAVQPYEVNMGVVIFSLAENTVTIDNKLWQITDGETPNDKNTSELIERVGTDYQYKTDTDQPNAVQLAIDLLAQGSEDNNKLIILITDGVNDDGHGNSAVIDAKQPGVIETAKENGIVISTIGFNPNETDFKKLKEYSTETGGVSIQIKIPEEIGLSLIKSILDNVVSYQIPEEDTSFTYPIEVINLFGGKPVAGLTLIFDSNEMTNLMLETASGVKINSGDPRMMPQESGGSVTYSIPVEGDYGTWTLTGNKPEGTAIGFMYTVDDTPPTPPTPPTPIPDPIPITTDPPVSTDPPDTDPPETSSETTTTTPIPVPVTTDTTPTDPIDPDPPFPYWIVIVIVVLVAGAVSFAIYMAKRPKLTGKIVLTVEGDGFGSYREEAEFDEGKSKQTLRDLFYGVADSIVSDSGANDEEVGKYFNRVTFEATGSEHGIKLKTEARTETIYPDRGLHDFGTTFSTSSSSSYDDEDDYRDDSAGTASVSFTIEYTIDKKEEEDEYGE